MFPVARRLRGFKSLGNEGADAYSSAHWALQASVQMTNHDKEKMIRVYIAAYNRLAIDGMIALLHPDVCFRNISSDEVTAKASGVERFRQLAIESKKLFSARRQEPMKFEFDNETVTVDIAFEGVLAADIPALAKSGETIKITGKSEFEFRDEKIAKITDIS